MNDDLELLHKSDFFELVKFRDYEFIKGSPTIAVLPVLVADRKIILRKEFLPCWQYQEPHRQLFLTSVTGCVEEDETLDAAVLRELREETGVIVTGEYKVLRGRTMYIGKHSNMTVTPFILLLSQYSLETPTGDGSVFEAKSDHMVVNLNEIDNYQVDDMVTNYLIMLLAQSFSLPTVPAAT